jgi:hypothetical protein
MAKLWSFGDDLDRAHSWERGPVLARSVSAGPPGYFRNWGQAGCAIRVPTTAALDPERTSPYSATRPAQCVKIAGRT